MQTCAAIRTRWLRVLPFRDSLITPSSSEHDEHFFAWLPAVPQGEVSVDMNIRAKKEHLQGVGYHDHNWGMRRWQWSRLGWPGAGAASPIPDTVHGWDLDDHGVTGHALVRGRSFGRSILSA